jgi:hypothetical protein
VVRDVAMSVIAEAVKARKLFEDDMLARIFGGPGG